MTNTITTTAMIFLTGLTFISCNSQIKENIPANNPEPKHSIQNAKIVKTQNSTEKGNVHSSLLDKKGNLWFGTTGEGVYRYDGKLFTQFTMKDGLSSNVVYAIIEDKKGNIWFATENGATCYDGKQFIGLPIAVAKNTVLSIMQAKNDIIWFGTSNGVYCYDGKTFTGFLDDRRIINKDKLHLKSTESILEDRNGKIWFGSYVSEGISFFDGKSLVRLNPNVTQKSFGYVRVMSILEDKSGNIWFGTGDGAYRYNGRTLIHIAEKEGIDWVYSMLEDKDGNIWFATEKGSGQMDEDGGAWRFDGTSFTKFTTKEGLIHNGVFTILQDNLGKLWFGTRNTGLCSYDGNTFIHFSE